MWLAIRGAIIVAVLTCQALSGTTSKQAGDETGVVRAAVLDIRYSLNHNVRLAKESHVRGRRPTVPVIVGLALALLGIPTLLAVFATGEASIDWQCAQIALPVATGVAFVIGWAGTHFAAWLVADRQLMAILGLLLFIAMGLCPPWMYTRSPEGAATTTKPAGYHLLFNPPEPDRWPGVRIDISRLAIQWTVVGALVGVGFVLHSFRVTGAVPS